MSSEFRKEVISSDKSTMTNQITLYYIHININSTLHRLNTTAADLFYLQQWERATESGNARLSSLAWGERAKTKLTFTETVPPKVTLWQPLARQGRTHNCKIQTDDKRFKRMLFIRAKQDMRISGLNPLSRYERTLKQQLNGEKRRKMR